MTSLTTHLLDGTDFKVEALAPSYTQLKFEYFGNLCQNIKKIRSNQPSFLSVAIDHKDIRFQFGDDGKALRNLH